jgi:hypothetical protein
LHKGKKIISRAVVEFSRKFMQALIFGSFHQGKERIAARAGQNKSILIIVMDF